MIWQSARLSGISVFDPFTRRQINSIKDKATIQRMEKRGAFQVGGCICGRMGKGRGLKGGNVNVKDLEQRFKSIMKLPAKSGSGAKGSGQGKGLFFDGIPHSQQDGSALFFDGIPHSQQDGSKYKKKGKKKLSLSSSEAVKYGKGLKRF